MKKVMFFLITLPLIVSMGLTSCVSSKKFAASEARADKLESESNSTKEQLTQCNLRAYESNNERLSIQAKYDSIQSNFSALSKLSNLTIEEQAKRIKVLNNMVFLQKEALGDLRNSISDALTNYKSDELYVYTKDGKVFVALEEKLLFKSGSDVVDPKGKEALKALARVINTTNDITVMIEGHTDDASISNRQFKDNWDLSTARAVAIVRILTDDNGFDPSRITASGKGKYHPVKPNETAEGRASNRRTEIILTPDLKELYRVLYQ